MSDSLNLAEECYETPNLPELRSYDQVRKLMNWDQSSGDESVISDESIDMDVSEEAEEMEESEISSESESSDTAPTDRPIAMKKPLGAIPKPEIVISDIEDSSSEDPNTDDTLSPQAQPISSPNILDLEIHDEEDSETELSSHVDEDRDTQLYTTSSQDSPGISALQASLILQHKKKPEPSTPIARGSVGKMKIYAPSDDSTSEIDDSPLFETSDEEYN